MLIQAVDSRVRAARFEARPKEGTKLLGGEPVGTGKKQPAMSFLEGYQGGVSHLNLGNLRNGPEQNRAEHLSPIRRKEKVSG